MLKTLLITFLLFKSLHVQAGYDRLWLLKLAHLGTNSNPKDILQNVQLKSRDDIKSIFYGNKDFGYFKVKNFKNVDDSIEFSFFPITYKKEIHFKYQLNNNKIITVLTKKYKAPKLFIQKNLEFKYKGNF